MIIAVHAGAGYHPPETHSKICALIKHAIRKGLSEQNGLNACVSVLNEMELSSLVNAGLGSNACIDGTIEMEAGLMATTSAGALKFAGISGANRVTSPISVVQKLIQFQEENDEIGSGLVSPLMISGPRGTEEFLSRIQCSQMLQPQPLLPTETNLKAYQRALESVNALFGSSQHGSIPNSDTVGMIALQNDKEIVCGSSSGGTLLKPPGRIGSSAVYGAANYAVKNENGSIGVCVSGCGEYIIRCQLARSCVKHLVQSIFHRQELLGPSLQCWFESDFLHSPDVAALPKEHLLAGIMVLVYSVSTEEAELAVVHNTSQMIIGYSFTPKKTKTCISKLLPQATIHTQGFRISTQTISM